MATGPDVSAITSGILDFGGEIFSKEVNNFDPSADGILLLNDVNVQRSLTKISASGHAQPYRSQDDFTAGAVFTDRTIMAYQSKWDVQIDPEKYRGTYLALRRKGDLDQNVPFYEYIIQQVAKEYLAGINDTVMYSGVKNLSGTAVADIADGYGTIIAAEITGTNITPVATGAITSANAVTKVELISDAAPAWLEKKGYKILCSKDTFKKYRTHYRSLNGYQFEKNESGEYMLDGANGSLKWVSWMGTSSRLILVPNNNLVMATDNNQIKAYPTPHLNLINVRFMIPVGFQIQDLAAIIVNDQA